MAREFMDELEENLWRAIECLESERYYSFSRGLYELLNAAKHADRLLNYMTDGVAGISFERSQEELDRATAENDWYRHE